MLLNVYMHLGWELIFVVISDVNEYLAAAYVTTFKHLSNKQRMLIIVTFHGHILFKNMI